MEKTTKEINKLNKKENRNENNKVNIKASAKTDIRSAGRKKYGKIFLIAAIVIVIAAAAAVIISEIFDSSRITEKTYQGTYLFSEDDKYIKKNQKIGDKLESEEKKETDIMRGTYEKQRSDKNHENNNKVKDDDKDENKNKGVKTIEKNIRKYLCLETCSEENGYNNKSDNNNDENNGENKACSNKSGNNIFIGEIYDSKGKIYGIYKGRLSDDGRVILYDKNKNKLIITLSGKKYYLTDEHGQSLLLEKISEVPMKTGKNE